MHDICSSEKQKYKVILNSKGLCVCVCVKLTVVTEDSAMDKWGCWGGVYVYKSLSSFEPYENVLLLTFITMKVSVFDLSSELKERK